MKQTSVSNNESSYDRIWNQSCKETSNLTWEHHWLLEDFYNYCKIHEYLFVFINNITFSIKKTLHPQFLSFCIANTFLPNEIIITFISVTSVAQLKARLQRQHSTIQTFLSCIHKDKHSLSNQHIREVLQGKRKKTTIKKSDFKMRRNNKLENWLLILTDKHLCFVFVFLYTSIWSLYHNFSYTDFLYSFSFFD